MRVTVLVETATLIDHYLQGEPGLALLVEDGEAKVLFDTGYSGPSSRTTPCSAFRSLT